MKKITYKIKEAMWRLLTATEARTNSTL